MTVEWLIGTLVAVVGLVGGLIARDRSLLATITKGDADAMAAVKAGDDQLHERLNRTRDDYVRRVDLDGHLSRLDETMKDVRADMKTHNSEMTGRIDSLIVALSKASDGKK